MANLTLLDGIFTTVITPHMKCFTILRINCQSMMNLTIERHANKHQPPYTQPHQVISALLLPLLLILSLTLIPPSNSTSITNHWLQAVTLSKWFTSLQGNLTYLTKSDSNKIICRYLYRKKQTQPKTKPYEKLRIFSSWLTYLRMWPACIVSKFLHIDSYWSCGMKEGGRT